MKVILQLTEIAGLSQCIRYLPTFVVSTLCTTLKTTIMSFDYILDTFGRIFKTSNKYKKTEKEAIELVQQYYKGTIKDNDFYTRMLEVQAQLHAANPNNVIDQGYPLWLNRFLGFAFYDWCQWYRLRLLHEKRPEDFFTPKLKQSYQEIEQLCLDKQFREHCRNYLIELDALP